MQSYHYLLSGIIIGAISFNASAVNIPNIQQSTGYDEIRTSNGIVCRQSMSGGPQLQIGALGGQNGSTSDHHYDGLYGNRYEGRDEAGVFIQFVMPIGAPERIDCSTIYDIEVEKQQLELQQLKAQVEILKKQAQLAGLKDLPELK